MVKNLIAFDTCDKIALSHSCVSELRISKGETSSSREQTH